jgi:hypothetical protein
MKRGTPDHPKTKALARSLGVNRAHAVGILECLWHFTAAYAPDGSLARFSVEEIAEAVAWDGEASLLIDGLKRGWLDDDMFVHDWPLHCEDSIHMKLARAGVLFACGCSPHSGRLNKSERKESSVRTACARHAHGMYTACALPLPLPLPKPLPNNICAAKPEPVASLPGFSEEPELEETSPDQQGSLRSEKPDYGESADSIYEAYPLHKGRDKALKAIEKVLAAKAFRDEALKAGFEDPSQFLKHRAALFAVYVENHPHKFKKIVNGREECFVPHPATWLNQGRWADEDFLAWEKTL